VIRFVRFDNPVFVRNLDALETSRKNPEAKPKIGYPIPGRISSPSTLRSG